MTKCDFPNCSKEGKHEVRGGLLMACKEHKDLAEFIYKIYSEAEFHRWCE